MAYRRKPSKPLEKTGRPPITREHIDFFKHISTDRSDFSKERIAGMLKCKRLKSEAIADWSKGGCFA